MKKMKDITMSDESIIMLDRIFSGIYKKTLYGREQRVDKEVREEIAVSTGLSLEEIRKL